MSQEIRPLTLRSLTLPVGQQNRPHDHCLKPPFVPVDEDAALLLFCFFEACLWYVYFLVCEGCGAFYGAFYYG